MGNDSAELQYTLFYIGLYLTSPGTLQFDNGAHFFIDYDVD